QDLFDDLMRRQAQGLALNCIPALAWPGGGTVADVGGGLGLMLAAVLDQDPTLCGILVEQPQVLKRAREFLSARHLAHRCQLRHSSLFEPAPPADVYLLSFILHDWGDKDAEKILNAVTSNAAENAVLRIFERLIPEDGRPHASKQFDIGMLLLLGEGRERTARELEGLLRRTGWEIDEIIPAYGTIDMIQARRADG